MEKDKTMSGFKVNKDLLLRFKIKCLTNKVTMTEIITKAIKTYLGE